MKEKYINIDEKKMLNTKISLLIDLYEVTAGVIQFLSNESKIPIIIILEGADMYISFFTNPEDIFTPEY